MNDTVFCIGGEVIIDGANIIKIYRDGSDLWFMSVNSGGIFNTRRVTLETPERADETMKFIMWAMEHDVRVTIKIHTMKIDGVDTEKEVLAKGV